MKSTLLFLIIAVAGGRLLAQAPQTPCSASNLNQAYSDNVNNVQYLCTAAGWKANIGIGAPTVACASRNYGQQYTDVSGNATYSCGIAGWFQGSGGGGPPSGPASGALGGSYPAPSLAASGLIPNGWTATTQSPGDNSTKIATTAYVDANTGTGLPTASGINQAPISTGAGTTYNAATVPVSFGTAQNQYVQQSITNSNYTTLNVNGLNDDIWVNGFAGGPYTGVGQAEIAWTGGTPNQPLGQVVSYSGGHYVAITYPNTGVAPTSNVTVWWPKATGDATTQADLAFATAAGYAAAENRQVTLRSGSANWDMTGWIEPGGLYSVNVVGCGIFCTNWNYTGTAAVPMLQRPTGGNFTFLEISDAQWTPNEVASSVFDLGAVNQSDYHNMQWSEPAPGSTFFARFGTSGGDNFQSYRRDITLGTNTGQAIPTASVTANVVGGSITSYTVTGGGSNYPTADARHIYYVQVNGYKGGASTQPCTVMPTGQVVTVSGGAVSAVSEGSNSGGSGCSGTIDVAVFTYYPVQWGIYDNASDSNSDNITCYAGSPAGGCLYDNGGDAQFNHIHPSFIANGITTICDADVFVGTELDNVYNQGFNFTQPFAHPGCSVVGTHAYGVVPGATPYYFGSAASEVAISSNASLCNTTPPADWHEFVTQSGTIDSPSDYASKAPSGLRVINNDTSCGQSMGDYVPIFTTGTLKAATFNPTSVSSQSILNPPTSTATGSNNYGSTGNFGPQASWWDGTTHQTSTATQAMAATPGTNPGLADTFDISPCPSDCTFYFNKPLVSTTTIQALHYIGYETPAPTLAAGAGAGTSPTINFGSGFQSDLSGYIAVATGTSPTASSVIATLTFGTAYAYPGPKCFAWPANAATQALVGAAAAQFFPADTTTTTVALRQGSTPLAAATDFEWGYACTN